MIAGAVKLARVRERPEMAPNYCDCNHMVMCCKMFPVRYLY